MFVNQVSIKDLFSNNASSVVTHRQDPGDSVIESGSQGNSQFPYSQIEFTDSQDASQSHSQTNDSPGRKFYQRYMSKGPVFCRDASGRSATLPSSQPQSFQQQLATNKAKARDRDERDLLNTMLNTMKCTASEVKDVVSTVKQQIANGEADIKHGLQKHLESLEARLVHYNDELIKALGIRDEVKEQKNVLQTKLAEREAYITGLKDEIVTLKDINEQGILQSMEQLFKDDRNNLQEHIKTKGLYKFIILFAFGHPFFTNMLQYLYKQHECTLKEQGSHQQDLHEEFIQQSERQHKQMATRFKSALADIGKTLKSELCGQWKELRKDQDQLSQQLLAELHQMQAEHRRQTKDMFKTQVKVLQGDSEGRLKQVLQEQQQQLYHVQQRHGQQLQDFIKKQLSSLEDDQKSHMDAMVNSIWCKAEQMVAKKTPDNDGHEELEKLRQRHKIEVEAFKKQRDMNENKRRDSASNTYEWNKTHYHDVSNDQDRCSTSVSCYENKATSSVDGCSHLITTNSSVLSLDGYGGKNEDDVTCSEKVPDFPPLASPLLWSYPDLKSGDTMHAGYGAKGLFGAREGKVDIKFSNRNPNNMGFVSPLTGIVRSMNRKTLFQRPSPSPVATVLPQIQSQHSGVPKSLKKPAKKRRKRASKYGNKRNKKRFGSEINEDNQAGDELEMEPESFSSPVIYGSAGKNERNHNSSSLPEGNVHTSSDHFISRNSYSQSKPAYDDGIIRHNQRNERATKERFELPDDKNPSTLLSNQVPKTRRFYEPVKTYSKTATVAPQPSFTMLPIKPKLPSKDDSETEDSDGLLSQESSPSLSIKEVFIKHIYKKDCRTPVNPQGVAETNIYMQARHQSNRKNIDSRFYGSTQCVNNGSGNTPGIEIHSESHKLRSPLEEITEKHFEEEAIQPRMTRRRSQKRKRRI